MILQNDRMHELHDQRLLQSVQGGRCIHQDLETDYDPSHDNTWHGVLLLDLDFLLHHRHHHVQEAMMHPWFVVCQ